jgi:hypothetical protein
MGKTVEDFKAAIEGIAPSNRYEVLFERTAFLLTFPKQEYKYLVSSCNIPGQQLRTNSVSFWGMKKEIVSTIDFDPINISFYCDKDMKMRRIFEEWVDEIIDKSTFTVGYYEDYTCDMTITVLNKQLEPLREYKVREVHPTELSDIKIGYDKENEPMSFTVTFKYWDFEIRNLLKGA